MQHLEGLEKIERWANEIQSSWNGDESGRAEERADQARDILEALKNLKELIKEMEEL